MQRLVFPSILLAAVVAIVLGWAIVSPGVVRGESTATTKEVELANKAGLGVKDVKGKCSLTVKDDNSLSAECEFKNESKEEKRFVFCFMIDLKKEMKGDVEGIEGKDFQFVQEVVAGVDTLKCKKLTTKSASKSSWHFGCKEVKLKAGESKKESFDSDGKYKPPKDEKPNAHDFQVLYADVHDLTNKPGKRFDKDSCKDLKGQARAAGGSPSVGDIMAAWVMQHHDFIDPYVVRMFRS